MFRLGLAMAGAVSAGAYAAGAVDFLIEALEAWEGARAAAPERVPAHRVVLQAVSGTSAGGMAAALATLALARGGPPTSDGAGRMRAFLPELYDAFVTAPRLVDDGAGGGLLGVADLRPGRPLASLLDATLLDEVAERCLAASAGPRALRPYLADPLHVFLTLGNLEGLPYTLDFHDRAGATTHLMRCHGDRVHFAVRGLGAVPLRSAWLDAWGDQGITLEAAVPRSADAWRLFVETALATGAFPLGLPARRLPLPAGHFERRAYPMTERHAPEQVRAVWEAGPPRVATAVDGGLFNNEPFELARWTLMAEPGHGNERSPRHADRAVLLVDPLPEPPAAPTFDPGASPLLAVLGALLPALLNQSRFKPTELAAAADEAVASRFLLTPERAGAVGEAALATAGLNAFMGFLDPALRAHDFALGRRNCQHFLATCLRLDADNPVVAGWSAVAAANPRHAGAGRRVLIPLCGEATRLVPLPPWPEVARGELDRVVRRLGERADAIVERALTGTRTRRVHRFLVRRLWRMKRGAALEAARALMLRELARRGQLEITA